ncbi:hypothetical protein [Janthinobacterium aquaticum]|uniref:hypothetical protein n=1 Tax=Janthinobacterium sp. FT58W TaxID=2654254 RepID=UPI001265455D|nr:hypothetical protein [Janthinobacterium sp. FT58W]KAB8038473.1 hypothetical protein GCM43_21850 [Janthinobacterium sp. FT58W]
MASALRLKNTITRTEQLIHVNQQTLVYLMLPCNSKASIWAVAIVDRMFSCNSLSQSQETCLYHKGNKMNDCKDTLTFDSEVTTTDYLAISSILSLVSRENYDEVKTKWNAIIPEYFTGNFDDFKVARSKLTMLFFELNYTSLSAQHFKRALSPDAAKNYAACVAESANDPIVAWVEKYDDNFVYITTQNRMTDVRVLCKVVGSNQPVAEPSTLVTGASEILVFPWVPRKGITVSVNVLNVATENNLKGVIIQIPPIIYFEKRQEVIKKAVVIHAGAGGHGSTAGSPAYGSGAIVADLGFSIRPETLTRTPADWVDGLCPTFAWVPIQIHDKIVRYEGRVTHAEADNGDTQRNVDYTFTVDTVREHLVEISSAAAEATSS